MPRLLGSVLDNLLDSASLQRLLGRHAQGELSAELTEVLGCAAEQLLSSHLTSSERRAVFQVALERLRRSPPTEHRAICVYLELLDRLVPLLGRFGRRFRNLSLESQRKCLQACERSRWGALAEGHAQLRHLIQMAFMECAEVWPQVSAADESRLPLRQVLRQAGHAA